MKVAVTIKIIEKYGRCPVCGSDKVGNGNILEVEDVSFKRTCQGGWKVTGTVDPEGNILETIHNCSELKTSMNE